MYMCSLHKNFGIANIHFVTNIYKFNSQKTKLTVKRSKLGIETLHELNLIFYKKPFLNLNYYA
jgi:hypothetical protein